MPDSEEPGWLQRWRSSPVDASQALSRFAGLDPVGPQAAIGSWRGSGLATGHPFDGMLESLGWRGKQIESAEEVHPLVFDAGAGRPVRLDPSLMPVGLARRFPMLARSAPSKLAFRALRPLLRARRPTARLRTVEFQGVSSAAIVYDRLPIIDHLRRAGDGLLIGVMDMRGMPPFCFLLAREGRPGPQRSEEPPPSSAAFGSGSSA